MNQPPPPWLSDPQWFPVYFVVVWLCITGLLSVLSGWSGLAGHFRAEESVQGEKFRFVSGSIGNRFLPVSYGNCLFITVNDSGFGLAILFLFRLLSPPLFIPWSAVASVKRKRFLFFPYTVVRLREQWPTITLRGGAGRAIEQVHARRLGSNVP